MILVSLSCVWCEFVCVCVFMSRKFMEKLQHEIPESYSQMQSLHHLIFTVKFRTYAVELTDSSEWLLDVPGDDIRSCSEAYHSLCKYTVGLKKKKAKYNYEKRPTF